MTTEMSNSNVPYPGIEGGLRDDYEPESVGQATLSAGSDEAEGQWEEYGLEMPAVHLNGEDTGRRLVLRNGEFIADVSDRYKLLPNEEAVEAADAVAEELGAVPFNEFDGDWYIPLEDHAFQDEEGRRVHALYAWDDPVDVGDGDDIQFGFAVHNSIDSSLAFQVGLFTFRHACANMVFMGKNRQGMNFDQRDVVHHSQHAHTKGLDVSHDALKAEVKQMLTLTDDITETYRAWRDEFITVGHIRGMLGRLPESDLPEWMQDISEMLDNAEENEDLGRNLGRTEDGRLTPSARDQLIRAEMPATKPIWETYNSLTESIWHSDRTNDRSKRQKMKQVHRVFEPAEDVR